MKRSMVVVFVVMMLVSMVSVLAGAPSVSNVNLSYVYVFNVTPPDEDLNASGTVSDPDGDPVKLIYDWKSDNVSVVPLNMPFEGVTCAGCTSNASDYGGVAQDGVAKNGAAWSKTAGTDGKGAYNLDGVNDFINISHHNELNLTSNFSMEAWIKPNVLSGYKAIISKNINPRPASLWLNGNKVEVWWGNASGSMKVQSNGGLDVARWAHVVATYQSSGGSGTLKLYINGVLNTSASSVAVPPTNTNPLTLGQRGDNSLYFNGTLDEVRLWKVALPADQVTNHYNKITNILGDGLTSSGQDWDAVVIPNDGFSNGIVKYTPVVSVPHMLFSCKSSGWVTGDFYYTVGPIVTYNGSCMNIDASNVLLDCDGYYDVPGGLISGGDIISAGTSEPEYGVSVGGAVSGVTVQNCNVQSYDLGASFQYTSTGTGNSFTNNKVYGGLNGIEVSGSAANLAASGNTLYQLTGSGIKYSATGTGNSFSSNTIWDIGSGAGAGLWANGSAANGQFSNNKVNQSDYGVYYEATGTGNTFTGNTFEYNGKGAKVTSTAQNMVLYDNYFRTNTVPAECDSNSNSFNSTTTGNHWDTYDQLEEGCYDENLNNKCDDPTPSSVIQGTGNCKDNFAYQDVEHPYCDTLLSVCKSSSWTNSARYCLGSDITTTGSCMVMGSTVSGAVLNCTGYYTGYDTLDGDDSGLSDHGVDIDRADNIKVEHCVLQDFTNALYVIGGGADRATNLVFSSNTVQSNTQFGVYSSYTSSAKLVGNMFNTPAGSYSHLYLVDDNDGMTVGGSLAGEGNTFNEDVDMTWPLVEIGATTNDNLVVRGNKFDGKGWGDTLLRIDNADGVQVRNNIFNNSPGNCLVNGACGILLSSDTDNNQIWNNDFINLGRGVFISGAASTGNVFDVSNEGNYWDYYNLTSGNGCNDTTPADGKCDAAYNSSNAPWNDAFPVVDNFPWTTAQN